ncbi:uncharacterized protein LOC144366085 [Ictidomys tridecemlineatus]
MDTEGLGGRNDFALKPLALRAGNGGGGWGLESLTTFSPPKSHQGEIAIRHVQLGGFGGYRSLHLGNTPKPYSPLFTEGSSRETRAQGRLGLWGGGEERPPPTPYPHHYAQAPANHLQDSRRPQPGPGSPGSSAEQDSPLGAPGPRPRAVSPSPWRWRCPGRLRRRRPGRGIVRAHPLAPVPCLLALNASWLQGPNTPGDSIQEGGGGGGGASQGPVPSGLAPAAPASACQGARGYPLPTASPTARRTGRQAGRTDQQTPSSSSAPGYRQEPGLRHPPRSAPSSLLLLLLFSSDAAQPPPPACPSPTRPAPPHTLTPSAPPHPSGAGRSLAREEK